VSKEQNELQSELARAYSDFLEDWMWRNIRLVDAEVDTEAMKKPENFAMLQQCLSDLKIELKTRKSDSNVLWGGAFVHEFWVEGVCRNVYNPLNDMRKRFAHE